MKILDAKVEWMSRYGNRPNFKILVDEWPKDFRYIKHDSLYYADCEGAVKYKHYFKPGEGYGGRTFELQMLDGSIEELKGPWSSNALSMNGAYMFDRYGQETGRTCYPCSTVLFTEEKDVWLRGYTFFGGVAIDLKWMLEAAEITGVYLVAVGEDFKNTTECSDEQNSIIRHGFNRKEYVCPWKEWPELPKGCEFSFYPSMEKDRLVKKEY